MPDDAPRNPSPPPDAPPPPEIPDYSLLRRIGRGSYGDVWLARSVTGVFRVIKVVQRARFQDDRPYRRELEGISRFQAAVSGLPRQLALLHVGRNDAAGYFYYVMEPADDAETGSAIDPDRYVPLTLREMLKRRGRLPASECIQFVLELARGLAVLHGVGLIHRDIKPSNIILVQRVPKLADVGLVASIDATLTGVGTPGYLPPEGPGSPAADIYSLGKVLYEIATGLDQSQFPRIPRDLAEHPDAPLLREINGVILKACNRFPSERHPSAEAVARDLEIIQAGRSIVLYEEFRKRSRAILIATATFATLAACAATLFVWRAQVLERANHQSRRALYRSDLAIAQLAKASGDYERARAALSRQRPRPGETDLRGPEWAILAESVRSDGVQLEGIPNPTTITKLAVDGTGRWIAASFQDHRVGIWDAHTGRLERELDEAQILGGFLGDGTVLVDEPDRVLRYESIGKEFATKSIPTGFRLRALLPDGRCLLVSPSGDYIYKLLAPESNTETLSYNLSQSYPNAEVSGLAISPNGSAMAIGLYTEIGAIRERRVISFNVTNSSEIWSASVNDRLGWIVASPNNEQFLVNVGWLRPVLFNFSNSIPVRSLVGHTARINDASYSTDGEFIATASADQTIRTWRASTGELLGVHQGLQQPPSAVAWSPRGDFLIAADESGSVRAFTHPPSRPRNTVDGLFADLHGDIAFSSNNELIAVSETTNSISLFSTSTLEHQKSLTGVFQPIAFSADGQSLIAFASDWSLHRVNILSSGLTRLGEPLPDDFSVVSWAIAPSGELIAVSGDAGQLALVRLADASSRAIDDPGKKRVWAMAFSENSRELWFANSEGRIRRWSLTSSQVDEISQTHAEPQSLALSTNQRWLAVSFYGNPNIHVLDLHTGEWEQLPRMHRRYVQTLFFTDDDQRLVSGGTDGRIVFWNVPEFSEVTTFELTGRSAPSGDEGIAILRISSQKRFMAALTEDGNLQLWRATD